MRNAESNAGFMYAHSLFLFPLYRSKICQKHRGTVTSVLLVYYNCACYFCSNKYWYGRAWNSFNKRRQENAYCVWATVFVAIALLMAAVIAVAILGKSGKAYIIAML